jgi:molybdopterin synthase catalytic subunit
MEVAASWRHGDSPRIKEDVGTVNKDTQSIMVHVQHEPISIEHLTSWASQPEAGAVSSFLGITRNNFNGKPVVRLEYEGYVPMAKKVLQSISEEIFEKWEGICRVAITHRLGVVPVGQASVIIVVSSPHRKDSLDAVHFAIDQVKALVPIWKKEIYGSGENIQQNHEIAEKNEGKWKTNKEWNAEDAAKFCANSSTTKEGRKLG